MDLKEELNSILKGVPVAQPREQTAPDSQQRDNFGFRPDACPSASRLSVQYVETSLPVSKEVETGWIAQQAEFEHGQQPQHPQQEPQQQRLVDQQQQQQQQQRYFLHQQQLQQQLAGRMYDIKEEPLQTPFDFQQCAASAGGESTSSSERRTQRESSASVDEPDARSSWTYAPHANSPAAWSQHTTPLIAIPPVDSRMARLNRARLREMRAQKDAKAFRRHTSAESGLHVAEASMRKADRPAVTEKTLRTRELAFRARLRQKERMSTLEKENEVLCERQEQLELENRMLKQQISDLSEKVFGMGSELGPTGSVHASIPNLQPRRLSPFGSAVVLSPHGGTLLSPSRCRIASPRGAANMQSPRRH